jgi:hypothetical protein
MSTKTKFKNPTVLRTMRKIFASQLTPAPQCLTVWLERQNKLTHKPKQPSENRNSEKRRFWEFHSFRSKGRLLWTVRRLRESKTRWILASSPRVRQLTSAQIPGT